MPAINMGGDVTVPANPSTGLAVLMSPFSGPKGSPFDAKTATGWTANGVMTTAAAPTNYSTGALSTGIGFGPNHVMSPTAPASIIAAGFNDDYIPGVNYYTSSSSMQTATTSVLTCIGGGKSTANVNGIAPTVPYNAQPLLNFGNGGSRDAGAGPAYTGFFEKTVTATGTVANGAAVETGFVNRSGVSMTTGQSAFGSSTAASAAVA